MNSKRSAFKRMYRNMIKVNDNFKKLGIDVDKI